MKTDHTSPSISVAQIYSIDNEKEKLITDLSKTASSSSQKSLTRTAGVCSRLMHPIQRESTLVHT
uniref:Uncharacterized protein n=1 Tax=Leersia perrieri TaxID=77586 RepID=A0A0D9XMW1_9ORYZ